MEEDETFTDFMVRCMAGNDNVSAATLIYRRNDGSIGYKVFNQEFADTMGLLRFCQLSIEKDVVDSFNRNDK